jgi:hypothetical protein
MGLFPTKFGSTGSGTSNVLTAAELDMLDGVTPGTTAAGKVVTTAAVTNKVAAVDITDLKVGGTSVTATAAQLNRTAVTTAGTAEASKVAVLGASKNLDELGLPVSGLKIGAAGAEVAVTASAAQINKLTTLTSSAAQVDAAVAGTPLVYRTSHLAAAVTAGTGVAVPAVAGQRFHIMSILMRATGGNVSGPATVGVKEDGGAIFLSHVIADLTSGVWHDLVTGTAVVTGMTSGGTTAVANKGMLVYCAGGDATYATATGLDIVVCGFYTTT